MTKTPVVLVAGAQIDRFKSAVQEFCDYLSRLWFHLEP